MSIFCKHDYEIIVTTISKPSGIPDNTGRCNHELAKLCMFGATETVLKCKKCNHIVQIQTEGIPNG